MDINIAAESLYPVPFVNSTLLPMLLLSLARQKNSPNTANIIHSEYDYIIVGGGSAGSVVANRLSEIPCVSVLLLEAGKPPPLLTEVPGIARFFWGTDIDWRYKTVPQRYCGDALNNRQVTFPCGKALGGSSILNGMLFVRGNRKNYDDWEAEGAEGWSYEDVLPYFKKFEDNRDPEYVSNGFHGVHGPQTVHRPRYEAEYREPLYESAKYLGYKILDSNAARQTGYFDHQGYLRSGQRCSTAKAYLVPAENRTNLSILPNSMVRKVLIKNHRAVGVQFDHRNFTYEVRAKREVIVSAGTVNTPQLLMLSGIGPRKELERFKIPIFAELPVGENLQDHTGSALHFRLSPTIPPYLVKVFNAVYITQYIQNRTGPLGSTEFVSALTFLNKDNESRHKDFPNHEIYIAEALSEIGSQLNVRPDVQARFYAPLEGQPFYICIVHILQPRSRGTVKLQSTDPYDPPLIDPNYYEDPKDIEDVVAGLKNCMRIGTSPPMRRVGSVPIETILPGCEKYAEDEDRYIRCVATSFVMTLSHQVGTARMGHPHDPRTVVDPHLRVKGIKGLRVVDASVMPIIPSGNTNGPTIMVAEKASDIIKSTIQCHNEDGFDNLEENTRY